MSSEANPFAPCGVSNLGYKTATPCLGSMGCTNKKSLAAEAISFMAVGIPVFIILVLGATGVMSNAAMGCSVAGIAGGAFLIKLAGGDFKKRLPSLLMSATFAALMVTLGVLGGTGVLTGSALITALFVSFFVGATCIELLKPTVGACMMASKSRENRRFLAQHPQSSARQTSETY